MRERREGGAVPMDIQRWLDPAGVDDVALVGDGAGVVGGEEEDQASDFFGDDLALEGLAAEMLALYSGVYQSRFWRSVTMAPGRTALTRILCGPSSWASVRVRPTMAALAAT